MEKLKKIINTTAYFENDALLELFKTELVEIGSKIYLDIFSDNSVRNAFVYAIQGGLDLSVSFMINKEFVQLPVEFMFYDTKKPLATRIPFYKTLTTGGYVYPEKPDPVKKI